MCSVQDGGDGIAVPKTNISSTPGRICMKCKDVKAVVITRVNDAFCRSCFEVYIVHKFRSTIGKSHLIRDGEEVLIGFSGGPASSALLHLVQEGLSLRAHKRLRFKPSLVHIDESEVLSMPSIETEEKITTIIDIMRGTGYPSFISSLQQALDLHNSASESSSRGDAPCFNVNQELDFENYQKRKGDNRLAGILNSITSMTAKEDYIRNLRNQLLAAIAHHHGYRKVMVADTSTRLAVRILSDIGQGRGAQLPADTHFADDRHGDVMFVRPIREITSKEVAMYNSLNSVVPVSIPTLTTKAHSSASIDHLTEAFVTGLQADFPSTVSNITRTAGKLDVMERNSEDSFCVLCQSPLDTSVGEASALRSVEFSQKLSQPTCDTRADNCDGTEDGSCQSKSSTRLERKDVCNALCYGCRLTLRDMPDIFSLPHQSLEESANRVNRTKLRSDIEEFILDGDCS